MTGDLVNKNDERKGEKVEVFTISDHAFVSNAEDPKKASGAPIPNSASAASTSALVGSASHLSEPRARRRILAAYWILGLCNNYGYVIMLAAAHVILGDKFGLKDAGKLPGDRHCNKLSTGAILLADIVPSLFIKFLSPFFPLWINMRMSCVVVLNVVGFLLVALASELWMALTGVVALSIASGLGEASLLAYTAFFKDKVVITMWSSGTGGAGVLGSLSFLVLTLVLSARDTILLMNVVPFVMVLAFWVLMVHPRLDSSNDEDSSISPVKAVIVRVQDDVPTQISNASFVDRLADIPPLLKFILPLTTVYLFEYFINQGMFELIHYDNTTPSMDYSQQYQVFQVVYQVGVFISRSSGSLIHIERIWILSLLQGINVVYFTLEAVYGFSSSFWVVTVLVLWEGLLGGGAYVNTYFCISKKVAPEKREFSMAITSTGDAIGISLAGLLAMPAHNALCLLPKY